MKTYKDNSGIRIRSGQMIRYGKNLMFRVVVRNKKLFGVPINQEGKYISLQTLCSGERICRNVNIISKKSL